MSARFFTAAALASGCALVTACSVSTIADASRPAVENTCTNDKDCGSNGVCTKGACYARSGTIDEVLLEIDPEPNSPFSSVSFLSMQGGLRRGDTSRSIALPAPVTFQAQVQVNGEDLANDCPYLHTGKQSVAARIEFRRTGAVSGVPVAGLSNRFSLTVDTEPSGSGFSKSVSLVPGSYDIYAQPVVSPDCQIASKVWRGVEVGRDGQVAAWAPPATLELPTPQKLVGRVERAGGTLADWMVDLIDPQDGRVISTSARLGATTAASPFTNFEVTFQPLDFSGIGPSGTPDHASMGPLIRLKPPKEAGSTVPDGESTVPIVYFDLAASDFSKTGQVNLVLSKLPTTESLVKVSGQVHDINNQGVRSTVKFINTTFQILGLPASYGPAATTDATGRYAIKLFPGNYRVLIVPEGAGADPTPASDGKPARPWALTERQETIGSDPAQTVDLSVLPIRIIEGLATAGNSERVAQGADIEVSAPIARPSSVLRGVLSPSVTPLRTTVPVDDKSGRYSVVLDPGEYDFALKPAASSNFAWWLYPRVQIGVSQVPGTVGTINPQLLYPVPMGGTITVAMPDKSTQPLRNATIRAYAITSFDDVTQVGTARTDDMGRYYLALPPSFYSSQQ